ncbi:hypothetical protein BVI2075_450031 [Burkholderia vietnamiensis]|nr:hypothetical protein BVI2075_450031 [Burkholderia vietnamiensis]
MNSKRLRDACFFLFCNATTMSIYKNMNIFINSLF